MLKAILLPRGIQFIDNAIYISNFCVYFIDESEEGLSCDNDNAFFRFFHKIYTMDILTHINEYRIPMF